MDFEREIENIFGPDGLLSGVVEGYEYRSQQASMAQEAINALASGDRLIIEAPTGTGKTLAYLIAAALSRSRTAVSTGTKNLQEQLFFKDIPFVKEHVFPDLKAALLKGRANFVCHTRLRKLLRQPYLEGLDERGSMKRLTDWYRWTINNGQGDRSEIEDLEDNDPVWLEICSTTESCLGAKCPDRENCFISAMRSRAMEADLMVVNHHLLTSDLAVKESGFGEVIPRYEALVVDEAHGLEDAATKSFGFHMTRFRLTRLVRDAQSESAAANVDVEQFEGVLKSVDTNARRLFTLLQARLKGKSTLPALDPESASVLGELRSNLEKLSARLAHNPDSSEELKTLALRAATINDELGIILEDESEGEFACWAEPRDGNLMLHASPVEVGGMLKERLYEKVPSVVLTSATLSSGGKFTYFKSRIGLDDEPGPTERILDSPFDYPSQTLLYVPKSMPEPNSPAFADAIVSTLPDILEKTKGRAFILFTSYRNMQWVYDRIKEKLPFPLLIQGSRPKTRLLEEFRSGNGCVLFATSSFWEGVDVRGAALSCVVIDKLPFAHPDDPIVSARIGKLRKNGSDPFFTFQVPMAALALKQGLGRLIRTRSDRGVMCLMDTRIVTKSYGRIFRNSLFNTKISRDPNQIAAFFTEG
jgi:ATP-dependent DNA helicase DinG